MTNQRNLTPTSLLFAACLAACSVHAAPDRDSFGKEKRPIEGVPVEAFELSRDDLKIEIWARSPLIYSPVAMDCDAEGRLWVTEGIDYNRGTVIQAGQSVMVVEDTDQDGKADSSHVFVTEKVRHAPLGIAVFDNQIVLSATPSIIVYTDVDRNAVFDPKIDKREVFLTGFQNTRHDHTLHAVVGAPSGQWHFSFGNCGADIKTKDGRHFLAGCYYGNYGAIGKPSSDGHVYVGGVAMRINPDGTGLAATGHNMRNPHDMFVTSIGDILQSDNDDPAHCRSSWVMEHANMGYSDLRDGGRSWEEVAKSWEEPAGWSKGRRYSRSHWRENYPGAFPPGTVYGAGSPTGNLFIEDDVLGLGGAYLVCCMVRKEVMSYTPKLVDAQIEMGAHQPFIKLKADQRGQHFLPTDVVLGTDGSLFLSDFYNNTSRRTNQMSGTIYRITRKDAASPKRPAIDFETVPGLLAAIGNPAVNVRSHAAALLAAKGKDAVGAVSAHLKKNAGEVNLAARSIWVLAQLGEAGRQEVEPYLNNENPQLQICAFRALRHGHPDGLLGWAKRLSTSKSPAVRREVAVSLRDVAYEDCKDILKALFAGYDGKNRYYLEALGIAVTGKEEAAYRDLVAANYGEPKNWSEIPKDLAWRLHTPKAIEGLETCVRVQKPDIKEFRHLAMAFASFRNEDERKDRMTRLASLGKLPAFSGEDYQTTIQEIIEKDLNGLEGEFLNASYPIPTDWGTKSEVSLPAEIAKLKGDAEKGKALATNCAACHKIAGSGVSFGPDLTHWGAPRTIEQIANEIVNPDAHLARGYDKPVRVTTGEHVADGLLTNYSWHAGSLKLKVLGGITKKILFRRSGARLIHLKESWMPSASDMGLTDQNVRDIAEYLKTVSGDGHDSPAQQKALVSGTGEGWVQLTGEDFVNVNCTTSTWRWEGNHAFCTGKPTGVIRYKEPLTNFEFVCEWMHKKKGGNSGVFVWATPQSVRNLAMGKGRLPQGIEVQVLDLGYREVYEKRYKKKGDWFTSHGDVFPVGPIKMRPFPPVAPNKRRSFPSKETTKGIYEWNHYYVRAVDGEVRLTVNGEEVSGGDQIKPAMGFLCLESEGAPIEYRNLRLKKLPPLETKLPDGLEIPIPVIQPGKTNTASGPAVPLKGHPILGTWTYLNGYTREFSADGYCVLRLGDDVIWKRKCTAKTANGLTLEGNLTHVLKGEILHIENRYKATKKKAE